MIFIDYDILTEKKLTKHKTVYIWCYSTIRLFEISIVCSSERFFPIMLLLEPKQTNFETPNKTII